VLADIAKILSIVMSVLGAVGAQAGIDVSKVGPIIAKVTAVLGSLGGLTTPSTIDAAVADLEAVLAAAKAQGVLPDIPALNEALSVISKFKVVEADYVSGQVAIISSNFSFDGIAGDLVALRKGGAAAQLLGM
jgi:hypothetical protein